MVRAPGQLPPLDGMEFSWAQLVRGCQQYRRPRAIQPTPAALTPALVRRLAAQMPRAQRTRYGAVVPLYTRPLPPTPDWLSSLDQSESGYSRAFRETGASQRGH
jgi:hypothetical protein